MRKVFEDAMQDISDLLKLIVDADVPSIPWLPPLLAGLLLGIAILGGF